MTTPFEPDESGMNWFDHALVMPCGRHYEKELASHHVASFRSGDSWAGYSPSNGVYWVAGKYFPTAADAAKEMVQSGLDWAWVDACIDQEEVA